MTLTQRVAWIERRLPSPEWCSHRPPVVLYPGDRALADRRCPCGRERIVFQVEYVDVA